MASDQILSTGLRTGSLVTPLSILQHWGPVLLYAGLIFSARPCRARPKPSPRSCKSFPTKSSTSANMRCWVDCSTVPAGTPRGIGCRGMRCRRRHSERPAMASVTRHINCLCRFAKRISSISWLIRSAAPWGRGGGRFWNDIGGRALCRNHVPSTIKSSSSPSSTVSSRFRFLPACV